MNVIFVANIVFITILRVTVQEIIWENVTRYLEILIEKACLEAEEALILAFQGGESMLVGLKFYQELIRLVEKYNQKKLIVRYSIQTNGTFIDDIWSRFF